MSKESYRVYDPDSDSYRGWDPVNEKFIDDVPLAPSLGQFPHQTVVTKTGRIVDHDEECIEIVDEDGSIVQSEDQEKLATYIKESLSVDKFIDTFHENAHDALLKLLALQNNKNPLKKGGPSIAYRTDALIMHCKMEFTANENIVFDAILGMMSSFPENKTYRIEPSTFAPFQKYDNPNTLYNVFKKGTESLQERFLIFDDLGENGDDSIRVPWFDILRYHGKKKDEGAFIEFRPTDFFKTLALCSQIVHGAYGSLEVTTQLRGKYTIAIYWFLENKKRYRTYPGAVPGVFEMDVDEIKHQFSLPKSYSVHDIDRRVFSPAQESINSINECDYMFEYLPVKVGNKIAGYKFKIVEKKYITEKESQVMLVEDPLFEKIKQLLAATDIMFTDDEINRIFGCVKRNNKTLMDVVMILPAFKSRMDNTDLEPIEDKAAYVCGMIEQGSQKESAVKEENKSVNKNSNRFNNFSQREYTKEQLDQIVYGKNL